MTARVKFIYEKLLSDANVVGSVLYSEYFTLFHKTIRTFWKDWAIAKDEFDAQNQKIVNKINAHHENNAINTIMDELKDAENRKKSLRDQIRLITKNIETGKTKDVYIFEGSDFHFERDLTPSEIANYSKTLKALHAELSLMGGDYAPAKIAETDVNGKDKEIVVKVIMDDND